MKNYISERNILITIVLYSFAIILYKHDFTIFQWTTTAEIPGILRIFDNDFLLNDMFTNSTVYSLKVINLYFVYFLSMLFNTEYYYVIYFIKIIIGFQSVIIYFIFLRFKNHLYRYYKFANSELDKLLNITILVIIIILSSPINLMSKYPYGWPYFQYNWQYNPGFFSILFGLLFNTLDEDEKYVKSILILISLLVHPIIGLSHLILEFTLLNPISFNSKFIRENIKYIFYLFLPFILSYFIGSNNANIDAITFVRIYVFERHPHHYLTSQFWNEQSYVFLLISLLFVTLSLIQKNRFLIKITFLSITMIYICIGLNYIGTEIIPIKIIANIGLTRYTQYIYLIFSLLLFFNIFIYLSKKNTNIKNKISKFKINIYDLLIIILPVLIVFYTTNDNLIYSNYNQEEKSVINFIKLNTDINSLMMTFDFDAYKVRIFGERAIYFDSSFPFSDEFILEYEKRNNISKSFEYLNFNKQESIIFSEKIDYIISSKKHSFEICNNIIFENNIYYICKFEN